MPACVFLSLAPATRICFAALISSLYLSESALVGQIDCFGFGLTTVVKKLINNL